MNFSPAHKSIDTPSLDEETLCQTLIVDLSKNFGGASTRVLNLMRKLPRDRVALAALDNSPVAVEAERSGFRVFLVGKSKGSWMIVPRLVSIIRKEGIQLLDTQNPQSKLWGSISAGLTGAALVSTLNSWYANEHSSGSWRGKLYAMIELGTNFFLDRYVVVSRSIRDALIQRGIMPDKIDLIYNAVETDQVPPVVEGNSIIESLGLPSDRIVLVAAGRLTWAKGYEDLIQALTVLVREDDRIRCLVAGDGELRESLEAMIEQAGLSRHVILLGHLSREKVLSLIAAGDIFVMPSRSEGTPIALLEAASLKKPIMATSVGGIPELVKSEEECLLVEAGDVPGLVKGIRRLIQDKALSERLGENAYRKVLSEFSLDVQALATIRTYNKALQAGT